MANEEHLRLIQQGSKVWNAWRFANLDVQPDLTGANLKGANLKEAYLQDADLRRANFNEANLNGADLRGANLSEAYLRGAEIIGAYLTAANLKGAHLSGSYLNGADLRGADLRGAYLRGANLNGARLEGADLRGADLREVNLGGANLEGAILIQAQLEGADLKAARLEKADLTSANLTGVNLSIARLEEARLIEANLSSATLVKTNLQGANLTGCRIFGISAWKVELHEAKQTNLIISEGLEPVIAVDNLEVAQFIYLLLNNEKIRDVIDTITSKAVLILGRFTKKRKAVLDSIREELRKHNYLPILFDFEKPKSHNLTETVSTLAHLSRFVIADITEASSIPQELQAIVPQLPSLPVQPLIQRDFKVYGMGPDFFSYSTMLPLYQYDSLESLISALADRVIAPAEAKVREIEARQKVIADMLANQDG